MKKIAISVCLMIIFYSCNKVDLEYDIFGDFPKTVHLKDFEVITSDLLAPEGVVLLDSLVFINERSSDRMIVGYDMSTRTSKSFLMRGRGPGETENLLSISAYGDAMIQATVHPETLLLYDRNKLEDGMMPDEVIPLKKESSAFVNIAKVGESLIYIGKDINNERSNGTRFCRYDLLTDSIHCFGEYPLDDKGLKDIPANDFSRLTAYQGRISVRPDNRKALCTYFYGVGFDIIDINTQTIAKSKFYQFPGTGVIPSYISEIKANVIKRNEKAHRGFIDSFGNNDYFFVLYSDKTFAEADYSSGRHILKYDWEGTPICHYILDEEVNSFTMDKEGKCLYATKSDINAGYLIRYIVSES